METNEEKLTKKWSVSGKDEKSARNYSMLRMVRVQSRYAREVTCSPFPKANTAGSIYKTSSIEDLDSFNNDHCVFVLKFLIKQLLQPITTLDS